MALIKNLMRTEGKDLVAVAFSFLPQGSSAPTVPDATGLVSVTRTGTGAFLVTFAEVYPELLSVQAQIQLAVLADSDIVVGTYAAGTTRGTSTLVLTIKTAGVAADVAADANNKVCVFCTFRATTVQT